MSKKHKLVFVISSLGKGGAERVGVSLCNQWAKTGHEVSIITFGPSDEKAAYSVSENVNWLHIGTSQQPPSALGRIWHVMMRLIALRRSISECHPNHVISFMTETNIQSIFVSFLAPWTITVSERIHPGHHPVGKFTNMARKLSYPHANHIVVQTQEIADWIEAQLACAAHVLENPIDLGYFKRSSREISGSQTTKKIVAAGRLEDQKGFDLLISAFANLAPQFPNWELVIFGDGNCRDQLEELAKDLKIDHVVSLPGYTDGIKQELQSAAMFVHSARYEGMPNIVLEALAMGLPVIVNSSNNGMAALAEGGENFRLLIDTNVGALSDAMARLMADEKLRVQYASRSANAVKKLALPIIANRWVSLLEDD